MAHILLGVTGSIAAFKAAHLASDWTKRGHEVRVVMTHAATRFVAPLTFSSLAHTPVRTDMFPSPIPSADAAGDVTADAGRLSINHIADAAWADALVVAPASADVIARIAAGMGDDTLAATILAFDGGPKVLCPAMNTHMYRNPAVQRNLAVCRELGWTVVEPGSGPLACGETGNGRMEEPSVIERRLEALLDEPTPETTDATTSASSDERPLAGLHVLVTAGPTREPLDPVRYLTNHSTGKMGYAIAEAARDLGARVTLVSGPVALGAPQGVKLVPVVTARDMFDAVTGAFPTADITVMAAAVGDFRVAEVAPDKIKKHGRESITLELVANPDILAWAGSHRRADGSQTLCGFAMETRDLVANAAHKLADKHCDMLVANDLNEPGAGFATDTNVVTVMTPGETPDEPNIERWAKMGKRELAGRLLLKLAELRGTNATDARTQETL